MKNTILAEIKNEIDKLNQHKIYSELHNLADLRMFMQSHVFAVLDFMSLAKRLQKTFAPIDKYWIPPKHPKLARFLNEIILAEETDETPTGEFFSHFVLYLQSMREIGAHTDHIVDFVGELELKGDHKIISYKHVPKCAADFIQFTFDTLEHWHVHQIAAAFCFGRETVIPQMFQNIINQSDLNAKVAPSFFYYLKRHIEVDGESHGPLAMELLETLCGNDLTKWMEVKVAAMLSIEARMKFWDGLLLEIQTKKDQYESSYY